MTANLFTTDPVGLRMTYGQRLEKALNARGKTRKELAAALDCTVQAIGMVITGGGKAERSLSVENHEEAVRYLRIDGYWLATEKGEMISGASDGKKATAKLSEDALDVAIYFDKLTDPGDRTVAYVAAMAEILKVLAAREAKSAAPAIAAPAPAVNPKKQDA